MNDTFISQVMANVVSAIIVTLAGHAFISNREKIMSWIGMAKTTTSNMLKMDLRPKARLIAIFISTYHLVNLLRQDGALMALQVFEISVFTLVVFVLIFAKAPYQQSN